MTTTVTIAPGPSGRFELVADGETPDEAIHFYDSHLRSDAYLRGCIEQRHFGRVACATCLYWRTA